MIDFRKTKELLEMELYFRERETALYKTSEGVEIPIKDLKTSDIHNILDLIYKYEMSYEQYL